MKVVRGDQMMYSVPGSRLKEMGDAERRVAALEATLERIASPDDITECGFAEDELQARMSLAASMRRIPSGDGCA